MVVYYYYYNDDDCDGDYDSGAGYFVASISKLLDFTHRQWGMRFWRCNQL